MTNLLEYDPDWKQKFWKNNPNWTIGEFTDMTAQMKAAKKRTDAATQSADTGTYADETAYTMSDGTETRDWGAFEHDRMYPGLRAASNAAGFNFLGATEWGNKDYKERMETISTMAGKPGEKFFSGDYIRVFDPRTTTNPFGNTTEEINTMIDNFSPGVSTSDAGTTDISGILGDIFSEDEENVV